MSVSFLDAMELRTEDTFPEEFDEVSDQDSDDDDGPVIDLAIFANGALKWNKLKQAVKDNKKDFDIWDFLGDELDLDTNGNETSDPSLDSYIGHLSLGELIESGSKWDQLKQAIKDEDFDIWDFLGDEM
jgi:hypothetical protein